MDIISSSEIKAEQAKAWNSIGDRHARDEWGKRGNEAECIRPTREATRATIGIVVNCSFCEKTHDRSK